MKLSAPLFRLKRSARALSRQAKIPLHDALDRIAAKEGFRTWSHLANRHQSTKPAERLLDSLAPGDMLLLAARPGHGKTTLGLELIAEAARSGRHAAIFSVELSDRDIIEHMTGNGALELVRNGDILVDLSDRMCSAHIEGTLATARAGTVAVVDYLQVLDQRRSDPPLDEQVRSLKRFAVRQSVALVFLSQVHRTFDPDSKSVPDVSDLRLPNPVDVSLFNKGWFLHNGEIVFSRT